MIQTSLIRTKAVLMAPEKRTNVRIDLHVHTAFGSACAELHDPESIPEAMEAIGLHGVVITEHNTQWPEDLIDALNRRLPEGRRIYSGMELSTSRCHVVVIGLNASHGFHPGMTPESLCRMAEAGGAATILVHPYQTSNGFDPDTERLPGYHGVEVASTMTRGEFRIRTLALCKAVNAAPVAGSDAHCSTNLGKAFTCFPHLPENETELALMIRKGLGVPMTLETHGENLIVC